MGIALPLLIILGIAASVVFYWHEGLRAYKPVQAAYIGIFVLLSYFYLSAGIQSLEQSSGIGAAMGLMSVCAGYTLACAANAVALASVGGERLMALGRWMMSYHKIPEHKSYDRAEGAVSNQDYARAVELYSEAIQEDPEDVEAHRRLAEVLLTMDQAEDAARVFRRGLERAETPEDCSRVAFRLAEVLEDELDRSAEAAELYRMVAEKYPGQRRAEGARRRLQRQDERDGT